MGHCQCLGPGADLIGKGISGFVVKIRPHHLGNLPVLEINIPRLYAATFERNIVIAIILLVIAVSFVDAKHRGEEISVQVKGVELINRLASGLSFHPIRFVFLVFLGFLGVDIILRVAILA